MTRRLLTAATVAGAALAFSASPAAASKNCDVSSVDFPGSGYYTSLKVSGFGCSDGKTAMRSHYNRVVNGKKGVAKSNKGYSCTVTRQSVPTEINGTVKCTKGSRKFTYTYQKNK